MRILLVEDDLARATPLASNLFFRSQLVRQAAMAGHELRRLVPNNTEAGKGVDSDRLFLRRQLDEEVAEFDPQIVHVCSLGIAGHLVLESGVPYLLSTWGEEFVAYRKNARMFDIIQQVLENAGSIVVDGEPTRQVIEAMFGPDERPIVCPTDHGWPPTSAVSDDGAVPSLDWLWPIYQRIIDLRTGMWRAD